MRPFLLSLFCLFIIFLWVPHQAIARLNQIRELRISVDRTAIAPRGDIENKAYLFFKSTLPEIKLSSTAKMIFYINLGEIPVQRPEGIIYNLFVSLSEYDEDEIGLYEKIYWRTATFGITSKGMYPAKLEELLYTLFSEFASEWYGAR